MAVDIAKCPQGANQGYYAGLFPKWDHFGVTILDFSFVCLCVIPSSPLSCPLSCPSPPLSFSPLLAPPFPSLCFLPVNYTTDPCVCPEHLVQSLPADGFLEWEPLFSRDAMHLWSLSFSSI